MKPAKVAVGMTHTALLKSTHILSSHCVTMYAGLQYTVESCDK